jgi:hypothetical protein
MSRKSLSDLVNRTRTGSPSPLQGEDPIAYALRTGQDDSDDHRGLVDLGQRNGHPAAKIGSGADLFVRGPVDWRWVVAVSRLGHCAGTVVDAWPFWELGVSRATVDRTLVALESAGLIKLDRRRGGRARVTLLSTAVGSGE